MERFTGAIVLLAEGTLGRSLSCRAPSYFVRYSRTDTCDGARQRLVSTRSRLFIGETRYAVLQQDVDGPEEELVG